VKKLVKNSLIVVIKRIFDGINAIKCKHKVIILIPTSGKNLEEEEKISLSQLRYYLGEYETCLLVPNMNNKELAGYKMKKYSKQYFGSSSRHAKLLYNYNFYKEFKEYEFILFYHLDSLVFSDQLEQWCNSGYDYIGAPWINSKDSPWVISPRVGNGGFSLLRVKSALKVFELKYIKDPATFVVDAFSRIAPGFLIKILISLDNRYLDHHILKKHIGILRSYQEPSENNFNNDIFWSDKARYYYPDFKVAPLEEGLRFSFEVSPKKCFELNGRSIPFGCHAWTRYDRDFWEKYLVFKKSETNDDLEYKRHVKYTK
jgi:hypothetical protein